MTHSEPMPPSPHPALRAYVSAIVAYDIESSAGRHRGLPSTTVTMVLPVDQPLDVAWAGEPGSRRRIWSCVSGLGTRAADIRHEGIQRGVQLALTPLGVRALLGVPAAALAGELVTFDEAVPELAALPARMHETQGWAARTALVEETLLRSLARASLPGPKPELRRALGLLASGRTVSAAADEVGYSRRHLGTLLRGEVGVTPKQFARLARFQRSRDHLVARARAPLAEVAAECGYADQAHLTREWTELAGCPPTTWLREELPFVQEVEAAPAGS